MNTSQEIYTPQNERVSSKEAFQRVPDLIVFDMDGSLIDIPDFYRDTYPGSLTQTVIEVRGQEGLDVLQFCRSTYGGKGELSLLALNIPFIEWAKRLEQASLDLVQPTPKIVERVKGLQTKKIVYTGSPRSFAMRLLTQAGFSPDNDFDAIMGWEEPELFPTKWTESPKVFQGILSKFDCPPERAWCVGDNFETDVKPGQSIGMGGILLYRDNGNPDLKFSDLQGFLTFTESMK